MVEALQITAIFLGMASVVAVPLAVLLGIPMAAWVARSWLALKERELELRRLEVALRVRETSLLPHYVDPSNTAQVLEWAKAEGEVLATVRRH